MLYIRFELFVVGDCRGIVVVAVIVEVVYDGGDGGLLDARDSSTLIS